MSESPKTDTSESPKKKSRRGQSIQIEDELAKPLQDFGTKAKMKGTAVARVILAFGLPKLISGEYVIQNGEIVPNPQRHAHRQAA